jgi:hypothetical protein
MIKIMLPVICITKNLIEPCGGITNASLLCVVQFLYKSKKCIFRENPDERRTALHLSLGQLAEFFCVSTKTISRSLRHLSDLGLITLKIQSGQKYSIDAQLANIEKVMTSQMLDIDYTKMTPDILSGVPQTFCPGSGFYTYNIIYKIYYNMCFEAYINDPTKVTYRDYWTLYHKLVGSDTRCSSGSKLKAKFNAIAFSDPQMLRDALILEFQLKFHARDTTFEVRSRSFATYLNHVKNMDEEDLIDSSINDQLSEPFTTRRPDFWLNSNIPTNIKEAINGAKQKPQESFEDQLKRTARAVFYEDSEPV